jgi:glycosyltransferase involved in cell wall biosynthesis
VHVKKRKKILFVIPSLVGGGAERVTLNILKHLDRERFIPHLAMFSYEGEYLTQVPNDVSIYNLNWDLKKKQWINIFKLIKILAFKIYSELKPDIIISSLVYANLIVIISRKFSPIKPPIIITEQNNTLQAQNNFRILKIKTLWWIKRIYPQADEIIAVSKGVAKDLAKSFGVPKDKIQVIYNGTDLAFIKNAVQEPVDNIALTRGNAPVIIACGRLQYQKNYPLLLEAFAKTLKHIDSRLLILGQGEDRSSLEELVARLGIRERVVFLGFQKNPYKYLAVSDIFVLSSRWEGAPNVLLEAMACGVPVISTRCHYGPEEIITDGVNGLLVPVGDKDAMADAIIRLLKDKQLREHLIVGGNKRVIDFSIDKMTLEYEKVIKNIPG